MSCGGTDCELCFPKVTRAVLNQGEAEEGRQVLVGSGRAVAVGGRRSGFSCVITGLS